MYETFEHSADVGIRGRGESLERAFAEAAKALFSVMVDPAKVRLLRSIPVSADGEDLEILFLQWLNNLIAAAHLEGMVLGDFEIEIEGLRAAGRAWGEPLDPERHEPSVEVKGATMTALRVGREDGGYVAQCVVDV